LKAKMLLDGGTPKVRPRELGKILAKAGIRTTERGADFGIVVGGDGRFSRYGRTEDLPLLFVGVRSSSATGSRAYLAETTLDHLPWALDQIVAGDYAVEEHRRLKVLKNRRKLGEVFTDVYLERGAESTCIRYKVKVSGEGVDIDEAAISNGVVVSTMAGASGYYSYPDRVRGERMDPEAFAKIGRREVGICHIAPTYTERAGLAWHPLRYTVPWGCRIEISLFRKADARLYGTVDSRAGVRVSMGDVIEVVPGKMTTKVISIRDQSGPGSSGRV
jgi:hypothetical protein